MTDLFGDPPYPDPLPDPTQVDPGRPPTSLHGFPLAPQGGTPAVPMTPGEPTANGGDDDG